MNNSDVNTEYYLHLWSCSVSRERNALFMVIFLQHAITSNTAHPVNVFLIETFGSLLGIAISSEHTGTQIWHQFISDCGAIKNHECAIKYFPIGKIERSYSTENFIHPSRNSALYILSLLLPSNQFYHATENMWNAWCCNMKLNKHNISLFQYVLVYCFSIFSICKQKP